ncbi:hypothetical protein HY095_03270 [Candidatus Micrarchaeota archaeon]|nr:hypothetical protein [Candidatus Micrarchaeota archaeon]
MLPESVQRLRELVPPRREGELFKWGQSRTIPERDFQAAFHMAMEAKRDVELWRQAMEPGSSNQPSMVAQHLESFMQEYSPAAQVEKESRLGQVGLYFQELEETLRDGALSTPRFRLFAGLARKIHEGIPLTAPEANKVHRETGVLLRTRFGGELHRVAGACVNLVAKAEDSGKLGRAHLDGMVEFLGAHKLAQKRVLEKNLRQALLFNLKNLNDDLKADVLRELGL